MKVVVYTTIFGDSDSLKPAPVGVDAVCFVDDLAAYPDANGWDLRYVINELRDPRRAAWFSRCASHVAFPDYDRTIWIDASYTLTQVERLIADAGNAEIAALRHLRRTDCYEEGAEIVRVGQASKADVDLQLSTYRQESYHPSHLSVSCILVRRNTPAVRRFNETWAREIDTHRGDNTQLSLDYAAWKHGLTIKALRGTRHENPYATHDAKDHKRRRRPYDTEAA